MPATVQWVSQESQGPARDWLQNLAHASMSGKAACMEVCVRVVDETEGRALNGRYRGRDYPTNVLSFSGEPSAAILGDIVLCAPVVRREARAQGKPPDYHWAHMVVHGLLHLQGYDHQEREGAQRMEARERDILAGFGVGDPYRVDEPGS